MATSTALTVKDFLARNLREDRKYELIAGEVVEVAYAGRKHEMVKADAIQILVGYVLPNPIGTVCAETMYELSEDDALQPDVSFLLNEQIPVPLGEGLFDFAPALAIEVISSESASAFLRKVELYLRKGSRAVWALHSEERAVWIFTAGGSVRVLHGDQPVEADFLPGFSVPASRFFEGL